MGDRDDHFRTALHWAAAYGQEAMALLLLEAAAVQCSQAAAALDAAAKTEVRPLGRLLESQACPCLPSPSYTPCVCACACACACKLVCMRARIGMRAGLHLPFSAECHRDLDSWLKEGDCRLVP